MGFYENFYTNYEDFAEVIKRGGQDAKIAKGRLIDCVRACHWMLETGWERIRTKCDSDRTIVFTFSEVVLSVNPVLPAGVNVLFQDINACAEWIIGIYLDDYLIYHHSDGDFIELTFPAWVTY